MIDTRISEQAETILAHRYFLKDTNGNPIENTSELFWRVAKAIANVELQYEALESERTLLEQNFFEMMWNLEFLPNSPTLMNAGTAQGTLSACFVLPLEDSMEQIMKSATDAAMVQKFGGGTGFSLSKIRPKGAMIQSTHGVACGPIEVLKTLSRVSSMITQGGKRDGANMAVMSVRHPDILSFIDCKKEEGEIHNFNISVAVDTAFMNSVKLGQDYAVNDPKTGFPSGTLNAREVFLKIVQGAWRNGEPGMVFLDRINIDNKVGEEYGDMIATNPCGEQPLLGYESCNLGSINVAKFVPSKFYGGAWEEAINWARLQHVIRNAIHFLDNVIDANDYSIPEIKEMTRATRKIGLGVMGFADLLIKLRIPYNSEKAREVGDEIMRFINQVASVKSLELGALRGTFPAWEQSSYKIQENYRNACRLTVAPTGTISMIAGCASGIEPLFALAWRKQNILEGQTLLYLNQEFEKDAEENGFYSEDLMLHLASGGSLQDRDDVPDWVKDVYVTAQDIAPEDHVLMQAKFQQYVDAGISKTINFASEATLEDVFVAYMTAWETGCKGITVYRNGSRENEVLVTGHLEGEITRCNCESPLIVQESGCETCKVCG
ncbi:MAG: ribonucleoside-diphosphate reductase, adenosylcobalamin-dependent, partial [Parcubacteria group bacterium]|nr:ribonucleoside-diphosphate reductase, adenosylcobalamin-dependent [Parcubacteria group bacterium]